jgi:two-component system sensor histidine kinase ChiS
MELPHIPVSRRTLSKIPDLVKNFSVKPYLAAFLTACTVLTITGILDRSEQERFQQQTRANVLDRLSTMRSRLEAALNQRIFLGRGFVAYISTINSDISQTQFENLAEVIVAEQTGIRSIALYKNTIISHMYPLEGNEAAIGLKILEIPDERPAIERAISTRKSVVAGPVNLVEGGVGFITRTAIFLTPPGAEAESGDYWGMVGIVIDRDVLFQEVGLLDDRNQLQYAIRGKDGLGAQGEIFFGAPSIFNQNPVISAVSLPNGYWQLVAIPANGWPIHSPMSKWLWTAGGLMALVAAGLTFILISAPARLQMAVDNATASLRKSEDALKQANAELQHLDRLKDEFLANTSHELRTPLNGIIGLAESLIDGATGPLPESTRINLAMIVSSGGRLASLVNDILDFSKLRHQDIELQIKPVGMREIAEIVLTLSQTLVGRKSLQLINDITHNLPEVAADENRVQQILYNLVGNAIKFTESGTVTVSAQLSPEKSQPTTNEQPHFDSAQYTPTNNQKLMITVSDTGIGIPENKLERIFESFEQASGSTAREYGGTGLGLAIAKKLVELHGGQMFVSSTVGSGSQFTFTLPLFAATDNYNEPSKPIVRDSASARFNGSDRLLQPLLMKTVEPDIYPETSMAVATNNSEDPQEWEYDKFKILIVDDEPVNVQVIVNHLSQLNYAIARAANGMEALEIIETGFHPNLILLDVMMPKMTGYEVTQKLRQHFPASELPILMLTAKNQVSDLVEGLSVGANDYLSKPISKNELLARLKTHLKLSQINQAYGRFVPHKFIDLLNKESIIDVQLGDNVEKEMSILFADIRDFTTLSEQMTPEDNFKFINAYLSRMEPAIIENHGFVDKYIGDAIMALFATSADDAIKAGLSMLDRLAEYNQIRLTNNRPPIKIGIGINTGQLMLGTVGGQSRMDGTVISDAVNLASRLEGLTKSYQVSLLISHHTFLQLSDSNEYAIRMIDCVQVKGKSEQVTIFEVFDNDPPDLKAAKLATQTLFEQALIYYYGNNFTQAASLFRQCLNNTPNDSVAQIYLKRCEQPII